MRHANVVNIQAAEGAITAQLVIECIQQQGSPADVAWLRCCELAAAHGWKSPALVAYVSELAKRAARADTTVEAVA
jgi:hypothetical protein